MPLEDLAELGLHETRVTSDGLHVLSHCLNLSELSMDGRQFTPAVANLIRSREFSTLLLTGPEIDDESARLLHDFTAIGHLVFYETSVSQGAIAELKAALPETGVDGP